MGTEFKRGDRVRVAAVEGEATCVVGGWDPGYFGMDIKLDDGRKLTIRDESLVEKVGPAAPKPGTIFKFGTTDSVRFVMQDKGNLLRLWDDGQATTGYTWSAQSASGRKFTVLSEA